MNAREIAEKILNCKTYTIKDIQNLACAHLELENKYRMLNNAVAIASWNVNDYVKQFAKDIIDYSKSDSEITNLKEENERLKKSLDLALYYVNGDSTYEGLKFRIDNYLSGKINGL